MHKLIIIVLNLLLLCTSSYAQAKMCRCQFTQQDIKAFEKELVGKAFYNRHPLDDTQFYSEWTKSDIYLTDNTIIKNKMLRYNALLDEFIWKRDGDSQLIVINRKDIARINYSTTLLNDSFVFEKIEKKHIQHPEHDNMFVQLLSAPDSKVKLYKKIEVFENSTTNQLEKSEALYLFIHNDYKVLRQNKASLYRLFGDERHLIKQIINQYSLSPKDESDLVKVIKLYNGALEEN